MSKILVPVHIPGCIHRPLRRLKRALRAAESHRLNLSGDRDVEWSFIAAHMPSGPGEALDFGGGGSYLSLILARRGFHVTVLDLGAPTCYWRDSQVSFIQGDLLRDELPLEHFDLVSNCSAVEHVGLAGRYGVTENRPDGDLEAMARLWGLMKPRSTMLLTIPVGRDAVVAPFHRVYGDRRLPQLLSQFFVERELFWAKNPDNMWVGCDRQEALAFPASTHPKDPSQCVYALGCFVLTKT